VRIIFSWVFNPINSGLRFRHEQIKQSNTFEI
jgi:hypothetical protein